MNAQQSFPKNGRIIQNNKEILVARAALVATLLCVVLLFGDLLSNAWHQYKTGNHHLLLEAVIFAVCMVFMTYGNLLYQICLVGYYKRKIAHSPAKKTELYTLYNQEAPTLSILIPSYKEEKEVIWQTLMSAALSEYPHKNVVLLIDDPYKPKLLEDVLKLEESREIVTALQERFAIEHVLYVTEREAFVQRSHKQAVHFDVELNRLSMLYEAVATWIETLANEFAENSAVDQLPYNKKFFVNTILLAPARAHRSLALSLRTMIGRKTKMEHHFIENHYNRLASLFNVTFTSFERKKYANLSHEANKAMNLNSYIALVGKHWKEVDVKGGLELHETALENADFSIPAADYINTLDADTVMLSEYCLRLVHIMEQKSNEKLAVIQSTCSTIPGSPNELERVAGALLDIQFQTHQGYTAWNATSWVGANALLRTTALEEIKEIQDDNGKKVAVYIQDRTVIEDTESTIDMVEKGWKLYNYPERMTFSPMPADFGSMLIQRRRWANGGMIIFPKLVNYIRKSTQSLELWKEFFMRFHYLASTTTITISTAVLFFYPFNDSLTSVWLLPSIIPGMLLCARDLKNCGYKSSDVLRLSSFTMMLFPIVVGGVLKQFQQMITGKKIPFGRTPKIPGRTSAPALYCAFEVLLAFYCFYLTLADFNAGAWLTGAFWAINAIFMFYALVAFMGVKETLHDIMVPVEQASQRVHKKLHTFAVAAGKRTATSLIPARNRV